MLWGLAGVAVGVVVGVVGGERLHVEGHHGFLASAGAGKGVATNALPLGHRGLKLSSSWALGTPTLLGPRGGGGSCTHGIHSLP